jgi:hypothetical protein
MSQAFRDHDLLRYLRAWADSSARTGGWCRSLVDFLVGLERVYDPGCGNHELSPAWP